MEGVTRLVFEGLAAFRIRSFFIGFDPYRFVRLFMLNGRTYRFDCVDGGVSLTLSEGYVTLHNFTLEQATDFAGANDSFIPLHNELNFLLAQPCSPPSPNDVVLAQPGSPPSPNDVVSPQPGSPPSQNDVVQAVVLGIVPPPPEEAEGDFLEVDFDEEMEIPMDANAPVIPPPRPQRSSRPSLRCCRCYRLVEPITNLI